VALADETNATALENKVSNERVGIEMDKSLRGERPKLALELVIAHNLADAVFKVPRERFIDDRLDVPPRVDWITGLRIVEALVSRLGNNAMSHPDPTSLYLAAVLFPLGMSQFVIKKGKKESVVRHVVSNSLKLGNQTSDRVHAIVLAAIELSAFMMRAETDEDRVLLGRLLFEVKESWTDGLMISLAVLQASRVYSRDEEEYIAKAVARAEQISRRIYDDWKLDRIWERLQKDPILDGTELMAFLKIKGAEVRKAVSLVRDFAFLHAPPSHSEDREIFITKAKDYVSDKWTK
jgi:tRNA nucleotidyltransferase (CCA-adding enzyme)